MAPVPKKKHSRQRSRIRRGSKRIEISSYIWGKAGLGKKKAQKTAKEDSTEKTQ